MDISDWRFILTYIGIILDISRKNLDWIWLIMERIGKRLDISDIRICLEMIFYCKEFLWIKSWLKWFVKNCCIRSFLIMIFDWDMNGEFFCIIVWKMKENERDVKDEKHKDHLFDTKTWK